MRSITFMACIALVICAQPARGAVLDLHIEYIVNDVFVPSHVSEYQVFKDLQPDDIIDVHLLFDTRAAPLTAQGSVEGIGGWADYAVTNFTGAGMSLGGTSYQFAPGCNANLSIGNDSGPHLIDYLGLNLTAPTSLDWSTAEPGVLSIDNLFRDTTLHQLFGGVGLEELLNLNFTDIDESFIDFTIGSSEWAALDGIYVQAGLSNISARSIPEPSVALLMGLGLFALAALVRTKHRAHP